MKKRVLAMILTLLLAVGLIPMTASAASSINLTKATSDQKGDGWIWDQSFKTLTLTGVQVSSIELPGGSTIEHSGLNKIDSYIYANGKLTIRGFGSLQSSLISALDGEGDLEIDGGHLMLKEISAKNLIMTSGYTLVKDKSSRALVHVYEQYLQKGGYLRIENTEVNGGNGIDISDYGARVTGGFLEVSAYTAAAPRSAAIFCEGNEFINNGGVVRAYNGGQGPAMSNAADSFGALNGVTTLQSAKGKAIVGKAYTYGDERAVSSLSVYGLSIKKGGSAVKREEVLTSDAYVFCKMSFWDIDQDWLKPSDTVIDGFYDSDGTGFLTNYKAKNLVVKGGNYLSGSLNYAASLGDGVSLLGDGTLACRGAGSCDALKLSGKNTEWDHTLKMTGDLICVSEEGAALKVSSALNHKLTIDGTNLIAVTESLGDSDALEAMEAVTIRSGNTIVVHEGQGCALMTANLDVRNAALTCYAYSNSAIRSAGFMYCKTGGARFEDCSVSAVGGYSGYGFNIHSGYNGYVNEVFVLGGKTLINLYSEKQGLYEQSGAKGVGAVNTPVNLQKGLHLLSSETLGGGLKDMTDDLQIEHRDYVYQPHMIICGPTLVDQLGAAKIEKPEEPAPQPEPVPEPEKPAELQPQPEPEKPAEPVPQPEPVEPAEPKPQPEPEKPVKLTTPFADVPKDAYYYDATVWAFNAEPQITDGNGKDKFMPEQICTRGQVVTFLWRAAGEPEPKSTNNPFTDVKSTDYFYKPVLWAVEQGITDGTTPSTFSPNNPCKNSHILTFIWRALGKPDDTGNAVWYQDAYNWAAKNHLLDGTYTGQFDINAQCPRKNVVQYLYAYYNMK